MAARYIHIHAAGRSSAGSVFHMLNRSAVIVAMLVLLNVTAAQLSSAGRRHHDQHSSGGFVGDGRRWSRTANLTVFMHGAINFTDFVAVPGIAGLGSDTVTAEAGPFGSMFVYNNPLTAAPDASSASLGSMKGYGVTTSFDGATFLVTATANLSSPASPFDGTFNIVGLSGGPVPISGGTGDFLFVQGYTLSSRHSVVALNTTYQIDISFFWP